MKVIFEELMIPNVPNDLSDEAIRAVLRGSRPSVENATVSRSFDVNGDVVVTFTPKAAEKA